MVVVRKIPAFTSNDVEIDKMEIPIGRIFKDQLNRLSYLRYLNR
jgi:hypothetical protein